MMQSSGSASRFGGSSLRLAVLQVELHYISAKHFYSLETATEVEVALAEGMEETMEVDMEEGTEEGISTGA